MASSATSATSAGAVLGDAPSFASIAERLRTDACVCVEEIVGDQAYSFEKAKGWIQAICDRVLEVSKTHTSSHKLMVNAVVLQRAGAGMHTHAACFWDSHTDGCVTATVETKHMLVIVTIFACAV